MNVVFLAPPDIRLDGDLGLGLGLDLARPCVRWKASPRDAPSTAMLPSTSDPLRPQSSATRKLYVSHFLSTWNMRLFEFGAVLFLANIFPGTLLPMSIYALVRASAAVLLSPVMGHYIDRSDRLVTLRFSIIGQRSAVIISCLLFLTMLEHRTFKVGLVGPVILSILSLLACVEKLCAVANTIAVERDWVVVIGGDNESVLQTMNAQMRRIDLFCKLIGPLMIALFDGISPRLAILTTLGLNLVSVAAEYGLIAQVYKAVSSLQETASPSPDEEDDTGIHIEPRCANFSSRCVIISNSLEAYVTSPAFLPSFALSLLYLTVLSFSGQMTTYLLTFPSLNPASVGVIRTFATIFELSSTWLAPSLIAHIGSVRAGIWCLSFQIVCLSAGVSTFFYPIAASSIMPMYLLISSIILSRMGLYGFDLVAQLNIQSTIPSHHRAAFSSTEASVQNLFELLAFLTTIIFPKPAQFVYPACISFVAVCCAAACYAKYVRDRRGHLLHLNQLCGGWAKGHWDAGRHDDRDMRGPESEYEMVPVAGEQEQ